MKEMILIENILCGLVGLCVLVQLMTTWNVRPVFLKIIGVGYVLLVVVWLFTQILTN